MANYRLFNVSTSTTELKEITLAWFALSLAFAILFTGKLTFSVMFFTSFAFAAATIGISFLFHEFAHKIVAQSYGCFAEFRAFREMLILSILFSFMGFIFAAPGAVIISGYVNRIANGKIASAGVLTNLVLAVLFLVGLFFVKSSFLRYGLNINALLAVFNLLPFGLFDGGKIFAWDKKVWGGMMICGIILMMISEFV